MRLGVWAPLPHTIIPEPEVTRALDELGTQGVGLPVDRSYAFVLDVVRRAEALGFDLTLVAERLVARDLEAWVVASALAAQTSRIEILIAAHPGIVSPQVVAKMGASLDRLSGGRFSINVIPGRREHEFDLFGNNGWLGDGEKRYRRMDEFIAVIAGLWERERFDHTGEFFPVRDGKLTTRPMQRPRPAIYAASGAEPGKEIIARRCDTWFVSHEPGYAAYQSNVRKIEADILDMRRRANAFRRTLGYGLSTHVICAETVEAAEARAAALDSAPDANVAAKALGAGLVGTPEVVAERIRRYAAMGVDCLMLQFHPMGEGLELFAERVMPLVR